jgi:hypothetical protein
MMKLGVMAAVGLVVLGLCGWWLFGSFRAPDLGTGKSGAPPPGLEREKEILNSQLQQAMLSFEGPASDYLAAWEALDTAVRMAVAEQAAYDAQREFAEQKAGIGAPAPNPPNNPFSSLSGARTDLNVRERAFVNAWKVYKTRVKEIELELEKRLGKPTVPNDSRKIIDSLEADPELKRLVQKVEDLYANKEKVLDSLADQLWEDGAPLRP